MNPVHEIYQVPLILQIVCYGSGMALLLAAYMWMARLAFNFGNRTTLRRICCGWMGRSIAAAAVISLCMMAYAGVLFAHPVSAAPELSILCLMAAVCLLNKRDLRVEILKSAGVTAASAAAFGISFGLGWVAALITKAAGGPEWVPVFAVGCLWLAPFFVFVARIRRAGLTKGPEGIRLSALVWPLLFVCMLFMAPDFIKSVINSPKVYESLHAPARLQSL